MGEVKKTDSISDFFSWHMGQEEEEAIEYMWKVTNPGFALLQTLIDAIVEILRHNREKK